MSKTSEEVRDWLKYLFPDELSALKNITKSLPPSPLVVNIGAGGGTSGLAFMEARSDMSLVTIDITDESSPFGCLEAERTVFAEAGYPHVGQRWIQIHGDSKKCPWDQPPADLVFIDGDHSYLGCAGDIDTWSPRIRPGGILAIHDYEKEKVFKDRDGADLPHPQNWPGVDKAVREFIEMGKFATYYTVETMIIFFLSPSYLIDRVLDFSYSLDRLANLPDGVPCGPGCANHVSHACEICGRLGMTRNPKPQPQQPRIVLRAPMMGDWLDPRRHMDWVDYHGEKGDDE